MLSCRSDGKPITAGQGNFFIGYDISIPDHVGYSHGVILAATEPLLMPPAQWESERGHCLPSLGLPGIAQPFRLRRPALRTRSGSHSYQPVTPLSGIP